MKEHIDNFEVREREYFLQNRKTYAQFERKLKSIFLQDIINNAYIDAISLYRFAHEALNNGDQQTSKHCEILNKILNHCIIPASCHICQGTRLGYGGLGVLIHANTYIGKYCLIGTNVTLASAPRLGDFIYVATGAKIIGREISIGSFSIIGANAVVTHDVPPGSIVVGIPSRVVKKITPENIDNYLTSYLAAARKTEPDFVSSVRKEFLLYYHSSLAREQR
ncbi:hypothetical protein [uncultured Desulfovibrio sp.]|uniref:hypothetical protein n=1 Tax=uncultured Desulfovibrio sp. TaxID=167968 RepID=UPI0025886791|nr:hypothetical protein [uncultured Desulfovibrio sp.]